MYVCISERVYYNVFLLFLLDFLSRISVAKTIEKQHHLRIEKHLPDCFLSQCTIITVDSPQGEVYIFSKTRSFAIWY